MKLTKKLEAEILKTYSEVWNAYLRGDMRTFASILDESCYIIGSAAGEIFSNKKAAVKYYKATAAQITGKAEFRNRKIKVMPVEKGVMVNENSDFYLLIDDQWTFYGPARISSLFHKKNNKWKVIHQHGSFPDSKTEEGEQVNTDKIKAENIQLRDAVKRRTEELENKNRELEIETALERVRAVAMAMRRPEDLSGIGEILYTELRSLGFADLRNTEIIIISDVKETLTSYYYSDYGVTGVVEVNYNSDPKVQSWVDQLKKANDAFAEIVITEKEIKAWRKYREEVGHLPDPKLNKAKAVYYYSYSIGMGGLSISTFKPASKEHIEILERFRNVFNLSYQRYIDIAKAEAQAKEAQIELALERVRARTMAMQKSDELREAVLIINQQLQELDFVSQACNIIIIDKDTGDEQFWVSGFTQKIFPESYQVPRLNHHYQEDQFTAWRNGVKYAVFEYTGKEKKKFDKIFFTQTDFRNVPEPAKQFMIGLESIKLSTAFTTYGSLQVLGPEPLSEEKATILKRFAKVFEQTYTRFLDLQKAELQVREAQIETGLERVRSKTMAMHKSEEVTGIAVSLNEELLKLGFDGGSTIMIIDKETGDTEQWTGFSEDKNLKSCYVPYFKHPYHDALLNAWKREEKFLVYTLTGEEKKTIDKHYFATGYKDFPESDKKWMREMGSVTFSHAFMKYGAIHWGPGHLTEEQLKILQRFSKVFEQSYTRFLDLQKAEAQAREAKIEAALERVRSRSMAMHKSDDLHEVIKVVVEQLSVLSVKFNVSNFAKIDPDGSWDLWLSTPEQTYPALIHVPYIDHPIFSRITEEGTKGNDFFTDVYSQEEANTFFHHFFENTIARNTPEERKQFVYNSKGFTRSIFLTKNIWFSVARYDATSFTDEENAIFKRFANVFEQAYTRFLDLQKAEAQARETEIELSLERVRAKTMAMQKPSEFADIINVIGEQFVHLGFDIDWVNFGASGFAISEGIDIWNFAVIPGASPISARVFIPYFDHPVFITSAASINEFTNGGKDFIVVTLDKQTKDTWLDHLFTKTIFKDVPEEYRVIQYAKPGYTTSNISLKDTWLSIGKFDIKNFTDEQHAILRRFANAFGQAYTRFLDLQKAEAQAREAQIEAGLERVRSRAMAMQNSDELKELIGTVFTELTKLDIVLTRCLIMIYDPRSNDSIWWMANSEAPTQPIGLRIKNHEHPPYTAYLKAWQEKKLNWVYVLEGAVKKDWDDFLFVETELSHLPDFVIAGMKAPGRVYLNSSFNSFGNLTLATLEPLSNEHFDILLRFAKVFDLTYTRFNDLKQAEAQKREAQIELALERVRARTMAMHKSEELAETAHDLFQQLIELGGFPDRISIGIADESNGVVNFWTTDQQGSRLNHSFSARLNERTTIAKTYQAWKEQKRSLVIDLHGDELKEWIQFAREEMGITVKDDQIKNRRVHTLAFFSHGWILVSSHETQLPDTIQILERFASVFNLTYRRFLDLQKAEAQANEARIEIALERIRARALAMHKSDELMEVAKVLREQMAILGQPELEASVVHLYEEDLDYILSWRAFRPSDSHSKIAYGHMSIPKNSCEFVREWLTKFYSEEKEYTIELSGAKQEEWYDLFSKLAPDVINSMRKEKSIHEKRYYQFSKFSGGALLMVSKQEPSEEVIYLQKRAALVFDLAYRRFSDLQKAEAQAKEAQIETALEKVRSRSLAMHKSDELQEVVNTVFERLQDLNIEMASANIAIFKEGTRNYDYWIASPVQKRSASFHMPYTDLSLTRDVIAARESGKEFSTTAYSFEEKNEWFEYAFKNTDFKFLSEERKQFILNSPGITVAIAFSKNTGVQVNRYNSKLYTEGEGEILKRFSKVFEQAYIRFLDLEKAEAQARESQIEAALERVRSSSLAMHKSEELKDVVKIVFENFRSLGLQNIDSVNINIFHEGSRDFDLWLAAPGQDYTTNFRLPYLDHPIANDFFEAVKKGETIHKGIYGHDLKNKYFEYMFENSDNKHLPEERKKLILNGHAYSVATGIAKHSSIFIHNYNGEKFSEETNGILVRFSKVFDQAYTRFLDLQKAEAQAREAQIEGSLERVRSKTMAMHKSDELLDIIIVVSEQLQQLNIKFGNVSFGVNNQNYDLQLWMAVKGYPEAHHIHWTFLDNPGVTRLKEAQQQPERVYSDVLTQAENNEWLQHIFNCNSALDIFSDEARNKLLNSPGYARSIAVMKDIFLVMGNYAAIPYTDDENSILKRFANVFEQAYKRFLDLQKAEANAREAQIEAGLERVRAKAMAMHSSKDLAETLSVFYRELKSLSVVPIRCGVALMDKETRMAELTTMNTTGEGDSIEIIGKIKMTGHPVLDGVFESWLIQKEYHAVLRGNQIKEYYQVLKPQIDYLDYSHDEAQFGYYFMFNEGDVYAWTEKELTEDELTIYRRFTTVISLTYKRYKDLQQAEAQAREAKIEAGLERVRARTMAMHNSEDVGAATATMFTELEKLGIQNLRGGITIIKAGDKQEVWGVTNLPDGRTIRSIGEFDMHLHALWRELLKAKVNNGDYNYYRLAGKDKEDYINILNATPNYLSQPIKEFPDVHVQSYFFGEGAIWTNSLQPHSEEDKQVMKRFAAVFSLTFRRYQDLKKAEAQAREAQIEAGLERVRSRTMAMHKSDELAETAVVLFKQMIGLGIEPNRLYIAIINDNSGDLEFWITDENGDKVSSRFIVNVNKNISIKKMYEGWVAKKKTITIDMQGKELEDWLTYWEEEFHVQFKQGAALKRRVQNIAYFSKGFIAIASPDDQPETTINLLERFAAVFNLTYTRFNDLQQAEAQTREAIIETALEKVRGKAMAMHNSNDLTATASLVFTELRKLDISPMRCGVGMLNKENRKGLLYTAIASEEGDSLSQIGWVLLDVNPVLKSIYDNWISGEDYFPVLKKEMLKAYYEHLKLGFVVPEEQTEYEHHGYFLPFSEGVFYGWSEKPFSESEIKVLKRFASVIDLTFRRYIELQKSETNAREAVKQAALDRVRAEIASMRTINDLDRITPLIWNELTILGIPFIRCGVFIMDDEPQLIHTFLSTPDGKAIAAFHLPYDTPGNLANVVANWKKNRKYIDHWDEAEFVQFADILVKGGALVSAEQYLKTIPKGGFYLHFLPFLQGMLYVGNTNQLKEEEIELIQHVADAFSTAYARYEDFNKLEAAKQQVEKTLTDLKQAQTQLVQSEKMASLGEMTAGIAHEIQNPFNFVNNFSEVSKELLDEMKTELDTGNTEDAKDIADDVIQNLEKINHHGKRADAIVKSMLQHSRSSSGKKEPTDINSLADEYLRLAYHGLRAKDKSFNAKFETAFDDSIGKINIISQDIGRVLVNLINNAFYAVSERKKQESNGYEPTVEVLTKKMDDKIEITVKDNGNGIPKKVLDKIFQPFFTTKPTGQGTGLGLSLAYDIIRKGHGGELRVETKEGEGSEFIIELPASKTTER